MEVRSVSPTFILDFAIGVVAGGVALVGAEVGLRRPDVEPLPQHGPGPQLRVRTTPKQTPLELSTTTTTTKQTGAATKAKAPMSYSPASVSSPCAASAARRRGGSPPRRPPFPGARSRRGRGDAMAGAARAPARTRTRMTARRLPSLAASYSGQLAAAGTFAWEHS